ncbi:hypothetical protein QYE76_033219 [Lolium multiflorum]|uniref:Transposase (putative) gypsy type domain-containing protein n=1 Tax=Lolium multiflorum TaxID=4521 RepID=A0AAD8VLC4_LOLMU|nr:hypothetical protein QYE76_033219 [Lolium multiflorum]
MGYRVSFVDHLIRGLSAPIHPFLRGLIFVYGLQLHHLTPNSILHISIFITLCEAFLGVQPNWALWKRIFFCRRNGSANVAYNIGGVVIYVRSSVNYFDVKLPDSVQGWRKKWLYIREENHGCAEDNIPPFDGAEKILRRRSWDAEATEEERISTEALMTRIHELQNTRGKELSGIQITAYFLRTRVQPLQARKNPFWNYAGDEDTDRLSTNLEVKDLDRLIRKISSLKKKDSIPSTYRVKPYSATNALPKVGKSKKGPLSPTITKMPPLLQMNPQNLENLRDLMKRRVPLKPLHRHNLLLLLFLQRTKGKGMMPKIPAPPSPKKLFLHARRQLMIHTSRLSSVLMMKKKYQLLMWLLERPTIKELLRIGAQFLGYRDYASKTKGNASLLLFCFLAILLSTFLTFLTAEVNECANTLAQKLEKSEEARKKAESDAVEARQEADKAKADAAGVEDLRKRLHDAETSLSDHIAA